MVINKLPRIFLFDKKELSDLNPNLSPEKILELYTTQFPELTNATVKVGKIENDKQTFEFETTLGTKG